MKFMMLLQFARHKKTSKIYSWRLIVYDKDEQNIGKSNFDW
jgi:hypothetical protein